jgi:hypothetical protein
MALANVSWGEERITNELLLKLEIRVSPRTTLLANSIAVMLLIRVLLIRKDFGDDAGAIYFRLSKIYIAFIRTRE